MRFILEVLRQSWLCFMMITTTQCTTCPMRISWDIRQLIVTARPLNEYLSFQMSSLALSSESQYHRLHNFYRLVGLAMRNIPETSHYHKYFRHIDNVSITDACIIFEKTQFLQVLSLTNFASLPPFFDFARHQRSAISNVSLQVKIQNAGKCAILGNCSANAKRDTSMNH